MLPINNGHRWYLFSAGEESGVRGRETNVISIRRTFRYQLGNLLEVLSEFYNAVKVCRLNGVWSAGDK